MINYLLTAHHLSLGSECQVLIDMSGLFFSQFEPFEAGWPDGLRARKSYWVIKVIMPILLYFLIQIPLYKFLTVHHFIIPLLAVDHINVSLSHLYDGTRYLNIFSCTDKIHEMNIAYNITKEYMTKRASIYYVCTYVYRIVTHKICTGHQ